MYKRQTGALSIKNENKAFRIALNQKKHILVALWEDDPEAAGKLVAIMHDMGVERVFSADPFKAMAAKEIAQEVGRGRRGISPLCPAAAKVCDKDVLGRHPEEVFHTWCQDVYAKDLNLPVDEIFTIWISPCTALKAAHKCDLAMTQVELGEAIRRVSVSRYTMHQVWRDAIVAPFDISIQFDGFSGSDLGCLIQGAEVIRAEGVPAIRHTKEFDFADFFACPGGCNSGGGRWKK